MRDAFKKLGEAIGDIAGEAAEKIQDAAETVGEKAKEFKDDPYRFIPKQKPSLGRIVVFVDGGSHKESPAIVTAVHSDEVVNLTVFLDGGRVEGRTSCVLDVVPGWKWPVKV